MSPPPLPVIGQLYLVLAGYEEIVRRLVNIQFRKYLNEFNTICLWVPTPIIFFKGQEDIQKILHSVTMVRADHMKTAKCFLGDGLMTAEDDIWRVKRILYQTMFKTKNLKALMPRLNKNCLNFTAKLSEYVGLENMDMFPFALNTGLKSICNLIYGDELEVDSESDDFKKLEHAIIRIPDIGVERQCKPWLLLQLVFNFMYKKEVHHILDVFKHFNEKCIKETKASKSKRPPAEKIDDVKNNEQSESDFISFLDVFNNLQKQTPEIVNDNSLLHRLITFCVAGTDTSAISLSSGLFLLGYHPHFQEKLFDEIVSVVGMERDLTVQDLVNMPYMNVVYKETLRWASSVAIISRKTTEDIKLSSCTVPPGCNLSLSILALNNDPKTFPDPRKFDPDRFLPENRHGCNPYDFLPFGSGPRNCIGKTYSTLLTKIAIIQVLRKFKITTTLDIKNITWKYAIVLMSAEGYPVQLQRRSTCY